MYAASKLAAIAKILKRKTTFLAEKFHFGFDGIIVKCTETEMRTKLSLWWDSRFSITFEVSTGQSQHKNAVRDSHYKDRRQSHDNFIFIMRIAIPGKILYWKRGLFFIKSVFHGTQEALVPADQSGHGGSPILVSEASPQCMSPCIHSMHCCLLSPDIHTHIDHRLPTH